MQIRFTVVTACALLLPSTYLAAQGRSGENNRSSQSSIRKSSARQALDSRRSLLSRAAAQSRSTPAELATRQARSPFNDPQTRTGRLTRETAWRRKTERRQSLTSRDSRQTRSLQQRRTERSETDQRNTGRRDQFSGVRNRPTAPQADRLLAKRLADIDHLRDVAVENGNERLLEQADRLEELARRQFEYRTTGEKIRANEIFKPMPREEASSLPRPDDDVEPPDETDQRITATRTLRARGKLGRLFSFDSLRRAFLVRKKSSTE